MIRVALDATGGDYAPEVEVEGAAQALRELPPTFRIQLVGRTGEIEAALRGVPALDRGRLDIVEALEVVGMGKSRSPPCGASRTPRSPSGWGSRRRAPPMRSSPPATPAP